MSIASGASESSSGIFLSTLTKKILSGVVIGTLGLAAGCGSSNSSSATGPFSNRSLSGSYVCRISGNDSFIDSNNNVKVDKSKTQVSCK